MQIRDFFFGPFKSKYEKGVCFVDDIYDDEDFSDFYNSLENNFYDKDLYNKILDYDGKILEIGSGTGRIFTYLKNKGFDIYGIEPSEKMRFYIEEKYKHMVFPLGIEDLRKIKGLKFKYVIIPATTVSLFKFEVFENFLHDLNEIIDQNAKIYFDFWDEDYISQLHKKIEINKYKNINVYLGNYIKENLLILNIYINNKCNEKLGISKKYIYTKDIIKNICKNANYSVEFENVEKNIVLARLTNGIL